MTQDEQSKLEGYKISWRISIIPHTLEGLA